MNVETQERVQTGHRSVSDYMQADHRHLDGMFARVVDAVGRGDWNLARQVFEQFSSGLERHMQAEEQVLFPVFERVTGMTVGPVSVMKREHELLRNLLAEVHAALKLSDERAVRERIGSAAQVLELHNMKEERVIYPHTDRGLASDAEREALVSRMRSV